MKHHSIFIIAEIGINHNNSLDNCFQLINAAAAAGCNAVKFQLFKARQLYPRSAGKLDWGDAGGRYSYDIYNAVESFELPESWINKIMHNCKKNKIEFLSSVFDKRGADYLVKRGIKVIKLSSSSLTNIPLIDYCTRYNLPLIISTGGSSLGEIEKAVTIARKSHNKLSLLHCSLKYPTRLNECNLGVIQTLKYAFPGNKIGFSDHSKEVSEAAVQAVYLGAEIIEKHITLNKRMKGPDHFFALEPAELKRMVTDIRKAENKVNCLPIELDRRIYGSSEKITFTHERYLRDFSFISIFAKRDIKRGERIRYRDLRLLRPGKKKRGLDPEYLGLFKKYKIFAIKDVPCEEAISWSSFLNA